MPTRSVTPSELPAGSAHEHARWRWRWLRAPLTLAAPTHPMLVHFTIALSVTAFCFDLLAALFGIRLWINVGWWVIAAAVPVTIGALATGVKARLQLPLPEGAARSFLRLHMALGPTVLGLLVVTGCWRGWLWQAGSGATPPYLIALGVVLLAIAVQGYLGGELVYRYGAGVTARYREPTWGAPATKDRT